MTTTLKKTTLAMSITAMAAASVLVLPGIASAQSCYDRTRDNQTNGAVIGALAGGALGNGISGRHDRGAGTVLGAVLGAVVGSNLGKDGTRCYARAYDDQGSSYPSDRRVTYREQIIIAPPTPPPVYRERVIVEQRPDYYGAYTNRRYVETRYYDRYDHREDGDRRW